MASAAEIENYKGDPALALGSSALPGDVVEVADFSPAVKYLQQYEQNKFELHKQELDNLNKQRLLNQKKMQDAFDIGNYKIWDADRDVFNKKWNELQTTIKEPGAAAGWLSGDPMNPSWQKIQKQLDDLYQYSQFSTQQKTDHDTLDAAYRLHPEMFPEDFDQQLLKYREGGVDYRASNTLQVQPQVSANALDLVKRLKDIPTTQQVSSEMVGGRYVDTTETIYSPEKILSGVTANYSTDKKFQRAWDDAFQALPANKKAQFGSTINYASATAFDMLNGGNKVRVVNPFFTPFERAQASQLAKPIGFELVDFMTDLKNPNSPNWTMNTGKGSKYVPANMDVAQSPSPDLRIGMQQIGAFGLKDGKLYAIPKENWNYDPNSGKYIVSQTEDQANEGKAIPIIPIDREWTQILQPYIDRNFTSKGQYDVAQLLQQYAVRTNQAEGLGIPVPQGTPQKTQVTGTSSSQSGRTASTALKPIPPIPSGFTEIREQNGKLYFVNSQTKATQLIGNAAEYSK